MEAVKQSKVDRAVMDSHQLTDKVSDWQYWLSKTAEERFEALELLRQIAYGYDPSTARLQRVLETAQLERS